MSRRKKMIETLADYFIEKGRFLTKREYVKAKDGPIRSTLVLRELSSWSRLRVNIKNSFPDKYEQIVNPKVTEPKVTEPKVTEPKVTEPKVTEGEDKNEDTK